jgi:uncharacterized protein (DUF1697 family)
MALEVRHAHVRTGARVIVPDMKRYVAFLRGMNLGSRRIKNDELRAEFETLGFEDVATFRASGNVIFGTGDGEKEGALSKRIEHGLGDALGYEVPVFLRDCAEIVEIAGRQPFATKLVKASKGKLQVTLLPKKPSATARRKVLAMSSDEDRLAIEARELFWLPSGGTIDSDLDLKAVDEALGKGTQRTMGTIEQIATRHC